MSIIISLDNPTLTNIFLMIPKHLRSVKAVCKKFHNVIQNDDLCKFLVEKKQLIYGNCYGSTIQFIKKDCTPEFLDCMSVISNNNISYLTYLNKYDYMTNIKNNDLIIISIICYAVDCYKYFIETKKIHISKNHLFNAISHHSFKCLAYIVENRKDSFIDKNFRYCRHAIISGDYVEGFELLYKKYCQYGNLNLNALNYMLELMVYHDCVKCFKYVCQEFDEDDKIISPKSIQRIHGECQSYLESL